MRGKRSKQYRKLMYQYALHFNFREPYQVLVDAEMIQECARFKMDLAPALERTFHGKVKPMITQCSIRHLYTATSSSRPEKDAWIATAKTFERRRCGHHELETPLSTLACISSVVDPKSSGTNKHRYAVASRDQDVRQTMRQIPGVPLVYVNRSVMILEPMATKTEEYREREEKSKIRAGLLGKRGNNASLVDGVVATGEKRKRDDDDASGDKDSAGETNDVAPQRTKKKVRSGPKGPNPLSVKKAKAATATPAAKTGGTTTDAKKKRKRKHKAAVEGVVASQTTPQVTVGS